MTGDNKAKRKDVSPLALENIEGKTDRAVSKTADPSDDIPADIPDKPRSPADLEAVYDVSVRVSAVLGRPTMTVNELTKLGRGAVIELDRKVGEAIDI